MKNPDLLRLLHRDLDEAIDWAYGLEPEVAKATAWDLFQVLDDATQSELIRFKAAATIRALPPPYESAHDKRGKVKYLWPKETIEYALDAISRLHRLQPSEDLYEEVMWSLDTVLDHWYGMREQEKNDKHP